MTRAHPLPLLALVALLLAGLASAQAVRYTVEVRDANNRVAAFNTFRGGDVLDLVIGIHNAGDQPLEPGSVWIVLPPAEGLRTLLSTASPIHTDPERYVDADGRTAVGFEPNLTAYYPAFARALEPGRNHQLRIRLSVVSSANHLADLVNALHLRNRVDRRIGTRVGTLPAPNPRAPIASPPTARVDPAFAVVARHMESMFGHLGAVRYTCPSIAGINPERAICGEVVGTFRQVQQQWDLYFDWASETPITAVPFGAWTRNPNDTISRAFMIDGLVFLVTYVSVDAANGVVLVVGSD